MEYFVVPAAIISIFIVALFLGLTSGISEQEQRRINKLWSDGFAKSNRCTRCNSPRWKLVSWVEPGQRTAFSLNPSHLGQVWNSQAPDKAIVCQCLDCDWKVRREQHEHINQTKE